MTIDESRDPHGPTDRVSFAEPLRTGFVNPYPARDRFEESFRSPRRRRRSKTETYVPRPREARPTDVDESPPSRTHESRISYRVVTRLTFLWPKTFERKRDRNISPTHPKTPRDRFERDPYRTSRDLLCIWTRALRTRSSRRVRVPDPVP